MRKASKFQAVLIYLFYQRKKYPKCCTCYKHLWKNSGLILKCSQKLILSAISLLAVPSFEKLKVQGLQQGQSLTLWTNRIHSVTGFLLVFLRNISYSGHHRKLQGTKTLKVFPIAWYGILQLEWYLIKQCSQLTSSHPRRTLGCMR